MTMRLFLALCALAFATLAIVGNALTVGTCRIARKSLQTTRKFSTCAPCIIGGVGSPPRITTTNKRFSRPRSALSPLYLSLPDAESTSGEEDSSSEEKESSSEVESSSSSEEGEKLTLWKRIRKPFASSKDEGLTTRQKLAKMGLSALLSYGWISNVSYTVGMSIAWYIYSKRSGLSPLAGGRGGSSWKEFLAVYAGIWVFNNIIRPLRLAAAVAVTPYFDRMIESVQQKTNFSRPIAIALVVFLFNIVGTISLLIGGVTLASIAAGVPIFPGKA